MKRSPTLHLSKFYGIEFFRSFHFIGGVLVPFFLDWGQITFTQVLILQAWFMLWIMVLEIPSGAIADRFGRKLTVMLGLGSNIIALLVYSSMPLFLASFSSGNFYGLSRRHYCPESMRHYSTRH